LLEVARKPGDFLLVDFSNNPVGRAIRFGQWLNGDGFGKYEHAALYVGDGLIYEMTPYEGLRANPITEYDEKQLLWSSGIINPSDVQRQLILKAAAHYLLIDTDYSFADYGAIAAHRFHLPLPDLKNFIATSKHMICSQFVDQCYDDAGLHLFTDGRWPGYVTPGDLYHLLKGSKS
jgi:hypothetical protein